MRTLRIICNACCGAAVATFALLAAEIASAQAPAPSAEDAATLSATPTLTASWIKSKIEEIEAGGDVGPAARTQALKLYREALRQFETVDASKAAAAKFQEAIQSSPERTTELKEQLAAALAPPQTTGSTAKPSISQLPLEKIEQTLDSTQAEIATLKTEFGQLEAALRAMAARPTAARQEQSLEKQKLDELSSPRSAAEFEAEPLVAEAQRTAFTVERMARSARINLLEQELISLPARQALAKARHDLVAAKLEQLEREVPALEARINDLRQTDALRKQAQAEQVTRLLSGEDPVLEDYAKATAQLRQKQTELTRTVEEQQAVQAAINVEISRIRESAAAAQQILEIGSVGEELGEFLREMRAQLPVLAALRGKIRDREQAIVDARLQRLNVEKTKRMLADPERAADRILESQPATKQFQLHETLKQLVVARSDALARLSEAYTRRIDQLAKINALEGELLSQTVQLDSLLNDRLLWLPSSAPLGWVWLDQIKAGLAWLSQPAEWGEAARQLNLRSAAKPLLSLAVLVAFGALWGLRRRMRRQLQKIAEATGRPMTDGYLLTPKALLITVLISLHWPLLLGYCGWLLTLPPEPSEFAVGVGGGLLVGAFVILVLRFLQLLCLENGLFRAHFDWSGRTCQLLSRNLAWLIIIAAPVAFMTGMIDASKSQIYRDGLGRLTFLIGALGAAAFAVRVLSPRKGILAEHLSRDGALWLTRGLWYPILWASPLALAALAVFGFYDSASQLQGRLMMTVAIAVLGLIAYGVVMRQVLVARRRLEMQRAYERREKARAAATARDAGVEASGDATPQVIEAAEVDVASISQQTRTLLRMLTVVGLALGLWFVWRQMLPALGVLDEVSLWTQTITSDAGTKIVPVTLSNLLLALAIGAITFVAAHNLPGLLEITVLQRLSIEAGTRYAISAISRYSIIAVGLLVAFNRIGADWSQMQWIVAALGVGVGFGLQEIVANFVSGLIILFERPVRVGDTVTIGDLSGTVSRIQIRATSITDWDNREILVPNKALITGNVTNWTLSDQVTRLLIPVGIAYGSDTVVAQQVMMDAVDSNPLVLEKPAPSVFFLAFGDSALNYEVRAFVAQPAHRLPVLHDLHVAIERGLRERGIQIPFPQRDLHLKFGDLADAAQDAEVRALRDKLREAG
jgi:potassium-dependent mechanosensitive channel